jgi:transposase
MNRFPAANSVLVLDNASIHKQQELRALVEDGVGGILEFLPPYSPDYNPIEKAWAAYKTWLRENPEAVAFLNPYVCIAQAIAISIKPQSCQGWITFVPCYNRP